MTLAAGGPDQPRGCLTLAYYIDGHGFGHATRSLAVLHEVRRLRPELGIVVRTSAPFFLFEKELAGVAVLGGPVGPGTVQSDPLTLDVEASVSARRRFQERLPRLVGEEEARLHGRSVGVIAGDIPPLAFEVAQRLGVPSVALGNFSWDWIYEPYLRDRSDGEQLLGGMRESYRHADLLLRMPFHGGMPAFRRIQDIPHVVRRPSEDVGVLRRRLGLEQETRPVILVSFGGFGSVGFTGGSQDPDPGDFRFVVPGEPPPGLPADTIRMPVDHDYPHADLVGLCDAVISKPGYGTVAECLAARTPLLYTSRDDFREYPVLVEGLEATARCAFLPREDLLAVRWRTHLERLLSDRRAWSPVRTDGAQLAAAHILRLLDRDAGG